LRSATADKAARETRQHATAATHLCRTFQRLQALGTRTPLWCPPGRSSTGAPSSALARTLAAMQARPALAPRRPTNARNFDVARARLPYTTSHISQSSSFQRIGQGTGLPWGVGVTVKQGDRGDGSGLTVLPAAYDGLRADRSARLSLRAGQNSKRRTSWCLGSCSARGSVGWRATSACVRRGECMRRVRQERKGSAHTHNRSG